METVVTSLAQAYESFSWTIAIGVMVTYFVADALYAYYTLSVAEHRALRAANTGALLHFLLALGVLSYVENYLYIAPIAIGSWLGTYVLIKYEKELTFTKARSL